MRSKLFSKMSHWVVLYALVLVLLFFTKENTNLPDMFWNVFIGGGMLAAFVSAVMHYKKTKL